MSRLRTRHYLRWRIDQDYRDKLGADERAFLDKFNAEYYRAEFGRDALHPPELRKDCQQRLYAARWDAPGKGDEAALRVAAPVKRRQGQTNRYYEPKDYAPESAGESAEGAIVEVIERAPRPAA